LPVFQRLHPAQRRGEGDSHAGDLRPAALAARAAALQNRGRSAKYMTADTAADSGMVSTQAQTMVPATPHFTADSRRVAPTPMMAPVMVWVVDTGIPSMVAMIKVMAPDVSAQNPP